MSEAADSRGKPIPHFDSDEELEHFVDTADLSEYDLSGFKPFSSEFSMKDARINMRLPKALLERLKAAAVEEGIPYQRFMRELVQQGLMMRAESRKAPTRKVS